MYGVIKDVLQVYLPKLDEESLRVDRRFADSEEGGTKARGRGRGRRARGRGGALGAYSRPTVPRPGTIGDSQLCERPTTVPERPKRPRRRALKCARAVALPASHLHGPTRIYFCSFFAQRAVFFLSLN